MNGTQLRRCGVIVALVAAVAAAGPAWTDSRTTVLENRDTKTARDSRPDGWEVTLRLPRQLTPDAPPASPAAKLMEDGTTLLDEDFEGTWPVSPWAIFSESEAADATWGTTNYRAAGGAHSIWCSAWGSDAPGPGGTAPVDSASWTTAGPFDLTDAASATLTFDLWLKTELYYDAFIWMVSTDGVNFTGRATTSDTSGWQARSVSLNDLGGGIAIGAEQVWIAFVYTSDQSNAYEGAYIDNVVLVANAGNEGDEGYTYTTDQDFALGTMLGVYSEDGTLQLTDEWFTVPYLCVPNTELGTASRVDVVNGNEVSRYRTGPLIDLEPGPIAVDLEGACWVGNRVAGSIVKIGLESNGGCVDSNGNGTIDTSRDDNGNGAIDPEEILEWGADECVVFEVVLVSGAEEVFLPGVNHGLYGGNNLLAVAIDADNDTWVGVADSATYYHLDGDTGQVLGTIDTAQSDCAPTGGVVDSEGILWSATWPQPWVVRIDPATGAQKKVQLDHGSAGLALDGNRHLFVSGDSESVVSRIDLDTEEVDQTFPAEFSSRGLTTTQDLNVWVAAPETDIVTRYTNAGVVTEVVDTLIGPTAVSPDGRGGVWATGVTTDLVVRINTELGDIDLDTTVGDAMHEASGDMTGIVARNLTTRFGTWTVVYDSLFPDTEWGTLTWTATTPTGTSVTVRARSSNQATTWSSWEAAGNGVELNQTPPGRYLEIQASMQWKSGETPPTLDELTVTPSPTSPPPAASFTWDPEEPAIGVSVQFTDTSTQEPTSWLWSFGDAGSSSEQNPVYTYAAAGTYTVTLEATNGSGSDTASAEITVLQEPPCSLECSATAPTTGLVEEALHFDSTISAEGCDGPLSQTWAFGDGVTSTDPDPGHAYSETGDFNWTMTAAIEDQTCSEAGDITITDTGPTECVNTYWLPVASRAAGTMGSTWRTDLGLQGNNGATAAVELRLHLPSGTVARSLGVAVRAMVDLTDVVEWVAGAIQASAPVEVCADGPLVVSARTYNVLSEADPCLPGGTFGQYMAAAKASTGLTAGGSARLTQLRENADFRTNIGLLNAGSETAEVEITLFDEYGFELVVYTVSLAPAEWWQDNRPFSTRAGIDDLDAGWARVEVLTGDGIFAYASVIDNLTNDAMTVPLRTP